MDLEVWREITTEYNGRNIKGSIKFIDGMVNVRTPHGTDVTYYVGHETMVHREDGIALPRWQEVLFALMERNSAHVTDFFRLRSESAVEIGRQIAI
jgi:K+ transporter